MPGKPSGTLSSTTEPSRAPGTVLFETDRLLMRRLGPSDAAALAAAGNHPEVAACMSERFPAPYTEADALDFIRSTTPPDHPAPIDHKTPLLAGIFVKPDASSSSSSSSSSEPTLVGSMGMTPGTDIHYRTWTLGYFLTPSAWGKGYMSEAVTAFVRWLFETWPELLRVEASRYSSNEASGRVLVKSGFIYEGTRRSDVDKGGQILDSVNYGILRSDLGL